nr:hypothetical protein [Patulibacter sp. SYSU D01012]
MDGEKRRIARAALAHVPASGTILLDAGSTTVRLAELLPATGDLAVFTNALPIATHLLERTELEVHLLGGRMRRPTEASVGPWAGAALRDLNVDVVFAGVNGISLERGLTTPDAAEAEVKGLMLAAGRRRIVLADRTKLGVARLHRHGGLEDVDLLVTDDEADDEALAALRRAGVEVETA